MRRKRISTLVLMSVPSLHLLTSGLWTNLLPVQKQRQRRNTPIAIQPNARNPIEKVTSDYLSITSNKQYFSKTQSPSLATKTPSISLIPFPPICTLSINHLPLYRHPYHDVKKIVNLSSKKNVNNIRKRQCSMVNDQWSMFNENVLPMKHLCRIFLHITLKTP